MYPPTTYSMSDRERRMMIDSAQRILDASTALNEMLEALSSQMQVGVDEALHNLNQEANNNARRLMGRTEMFEMSLRRHDTQPLPKIVKEDKRPYYRKFEKKRW